MSYQMGPPQMGFPQMGQGDNSAAMAIGLIVVLAVIGFLVWWFIFKKTEGKKCKPKTADKVTGASKYEYDEDAKCIVAECEADYTLSGTTCVENEDCEIEWPSTFTLTTGGNGACSRMATVVTDKSGSGASCPTTMTQSFGANDANCLPLQTLVNATANSSVKTPAKAGTDIILQLQGVYESSATIPLTYGHGVFSVGIFSNGSNVYNNTITPAGTSNLISFAPISGHDRIGIGTENDVLAVSVPDLKVLKWVSSTELMPVFTYVKDGDYSDPKYDRIKFNLSFTDDVLTLASKINPANTFTIAGYPIVPVNMMQWYLPRLPDPVGYSVGPINSLCPISSRGDILPVTVEDLAAAKTKMVDAGKITSSEILEFRGDPVVTNRIFVVDKQNKEKFAQEACSIMCDTKGTACKSFLFDQVSNGGTCVLYAGESVPVVDYTKKDQLGGVCFTKK